MPAHWYYLNLWQDFPLFTLTSLRSANMGLRKLFYTCAGLFPVLMSIFAFPVILLARHNRRIGQLYYWFIFSVSEYLFLSRADHHVRSILFKQMQPDLEEKQRAGQILKVLEIGPGTGGNFAYYPSGLQLTTLELNPLLKKHAAQIKQKYPDITIEKSIIGNAEDMSCIPDQSFDAVVGTHILCCISDPAAAAKEIHRVLKQRCKFYTIEYVLYPQQERKKRLMQKLYAPFWRFYGMGCKAGSQDCTACLQTAGFNTDLIQKYRHPDLLVTHSLTEYGVAVKSDNRDESQGTITSPHATRAQNPEEGGSVAITISSSTEVTAIAGA